jgi:uncharacterized beta-barrel protein YwiB (DUF1934 family)
MSAPLKVYVIIESNIEQDQTIIQRTAGDLYRKGDHYYLRYSETSDEMKGTSTTIKLERESIRIIRQGSLRSEQTFIKGQRIKGYYDTPQGKLELETETGALNLSFTDGIGFAEWNYDLYVMGERSGSYRLKLTVTDVDRT